MGFVVDANRRLVTVDHSHNNYCVTTVLGNPATLMLNETLKVTSIFTRTKGKRDRDEPGDNCPMLYVMKGMHDLTTTPRDVAKLCVSFREILPKFLDNGFEWDWIVPLPSSSPVSLRLAKKVQTRTKKGACYPEALIKMTAENVLKNLEELRISARDKTIVRQDIKRFIKLNGEDAYFQIKMVRTNVRMHVNPLAWGSLPLGTRPPRGILLIDDMITSGTSLVNAEAILKNRYPGVRIEALTLFGSSK